MDQNDDGGENVFSLPNPEELICAIDSYYSSHLAMRIQISHPHNGDKYSLGFLMVRYFSGPTRWMGANFHICPWEEAARLYLELREYKDLDLAPETLQEISEKHFHLYAVSSLNPKMEIRIFAGSGGLVTE